MSEQVNRKCRHIDVILQLSTPYPDTEPSSPKGAHVMH